LVTSEINLCPLGSLKPEVAMNSHNGIRPAFRAAVVVIVICQDLITFENTVDVTVFSEATLVACTTGKYIQRDHH
jgi:hypothetical protein